MSEKAEKLKVQRTRKRIYETAGEEPVKEKVEVEVEKEKEEPAAPEAALSGDERFVEALRLVRSSSAWAAGAGLVPIPVVDVVAMTGVQIAMLKKLSELYGIPFHEQRSKSAVAALIGGVNAGYLGGSALKLFPFFGLLSLAAMPAFNGAITYAVGRVFIQHFASGGTFLDFDPARVKAYFEEQYRAGKQD
jgi:uncharacterized protein (DUF697 family)